MAFCSRGLAWKGAEDLTGAIVDFTTAINLNPEDVTAFYNRGLAKNVLQDFRGAVADFTRVL